MRGEEEVWRNARWVVWIGTASLVGWSGIRQSELKTSWKRSQTKKKMRLPCHGYQAAVRGRE